ncbi:FlgD immunoglobulin-like domain containing protein [Treponema sp.]|uniref:FlgD immunoglobulin-like domain containing protein n=1 Tax=Treponema sp. TaxID=166 RepID=UPI003F1205FC
MKKSTGTFFAAFALCSMVGLASELFAEPGVSYISPNNDGVQDTLEVPLKIRDKRYVKEWSFVVTDESGAVVRTIGNKISLPSKFTFKTFCKTLIAPKRGVDVPASIIWNGFLDDGSLAKDGTYYYQFTACDDNGNTASTSKMAVIVDNTPPQINLAKLEGADKIFGEGSKVVLKIRQSGSEEKLWTAKITDANDSVVRTFKWENSSPLEVEWNGTDENKSIVPDGIYNYEITSTDLAGNVSEKARISNIIFSAEKPEIAVSINGSRYFAPAPKGRVSEERKTMQFSVAIPSPAASVNSLKDWQIAIVGKNSDTVYYSKSGKTNPPSLFQFDGKTDSGADLQDGEYRARISAAYLNGYEPEPVYSPVFVVDNEAPKASVSLPQNTVFNGKNKFQISQKQVAEPAYTGEKSWKGKIVDERNASVKSFDFESSLPEKVEWDGLDDNGQFVNDGKYKYVLEVSELAGNFSEIQSSEFVLDTSKTELALSVSPSAFSPNADGILDRIVLSPIAKASSGIDSYELKISGASVVKTFRGTGKIPASFTWDGLDDNGNKCADGVYSAVIKTVANSGTEAEAVSSEFVLDTVAPSVKISVPYTVFSPDGISSRQNIPVAVEESSVETKWTAEIFSASGKAVKTFSWSNSKVQDFSWDGTDNSGNKAPNGKYSLVVSAKDAAGNAGKASVQELSLDARPVSGFITAEYKGISPNADGILDAQKFDITVSLAEGISAWKFDIIDSKGIVKTFSDKEIGALPKQLIWTGDTSDKKTAEGIFTARLHVDYEKGNVLDAVSSSFICTSVPPLLDVKTSPKYFSPDNDGIDDDLFVELGYESLAGLKKWDFTIKDRNGKSFWKTSGKTAITKRIVWDGRGNNGELVQSAEDYPFEFTAYDDLGMSSTFEGVINVDVLVVRDGDKLKMQIPSIIFRSNEADFGVRTVDANGNIIKPGITQAQADNNARVMKRVAEILKKFKDYKVTIVGHANRVSDNSAEETEPGVWGKALIPLSEQRSEYVKTQLVKIGVSSSRLSVVGKGGTEPVADRKDPSVNWKNRRVEFILEK